MRRNLAPNRLTIAINSELQANILRGLIQNKERLTQDAIDEHNRAVMELIGRPVNERQEITTHISDYMDGSSNHASIASEEKVSWGDKEPQEILGEIRSTLDAIRSPEVVEHQRQMQVRLEADAIRRENMMADMFEKKLKEREGKTADQLADGQEKRL